MKVIVFIMSGGVFFLSVIVFITFIENCELLFIFCIVCFFKKLICILEILY